MPALRRCHLVGARDFLRAAAPLLLLATTLPAQIWSEEFNVNGPPDPAVWSYDLGAGGWGNNELQSYTNSTNNVQVQNGHLVITARRQGNSFTSGRIRTHSQRTDCAAISVPAASRARAGLRLIQLIQPPSMGRLPLYRLGSPGSRRPV